MRASLILIGAAASAAGGMSAAIAGETLRVVEHVVSEQQVDIGPKGDSLGDVVAFSNPLFDESNTRQVGVGQGYCLRVVVSKSWECTWTAILKEGQIKVGGPVYDNADSELSIVGGTGKYAGAKGVLHVHGKEDSFEFRYELQ